MSQGWFRSLGEADSETGDEEVDKETVRVVIQCNVQGGDVDRCH